MHWETFLAFFVTFTGLCGVTIGLRGRFPQHVTRIMPIRDWRVFYCLLGLGPVLVGIGLSALQRPPPFGMPVSTSLEIGVVAFLAGMLTGVAAMVFWSSYDPTRAALMGIPVWLRNWMHGNSPLPQSPDPPINE